MKSFNEEDKNKIESLLSMLRSQNGEDDSDMDFLCTHCHCKVCSTLKKESRDGTAEGSHGE